MKFFLLFLFCFIGFFPAFGQYTFLHRNDHASDLINRYEIRTGMLRTGIFSGTGPYSREAIVALLEAMDTLELSLSETDRYNLDYLAAENLPWSDPEDAASQQPFLRRFYRSKANLYHVQKDDFFMAINPGLYLQAGISDADNLPLYTNTRAAEVRGQINDRIGFYSFISENQLRPAQHERDYRDKYRAFPGAHLVKPFKEDGYDFFTASGYVTFRMLPAVELQFGQSTNFIGHGRRSLLLSDFATDYVFLKINTKIYRFHYQNIFAQLIDRYGPERRPYPNKYKATHYLGIDILDNLNVGFFETVMFHDNNETGRGFDPHYLNPIIFYRSVEHQLGDADKMLVGMNVGYVPVPRLKLYGQLMINEFKLKHWLERDGWAHNKFGYQLGGKYVDALGISNLDIGLEYNWVRPYSYTHYDISRGYPVNNYSHYNQHLAHPLGANFYEWVASVRLQPWPRVSMGLEAIMATYGADADGSNWGQNIFLDYTTYERRFGNYTAQGIKTDLLIAEAWMSYQLRHNLFVDFDLRYRRMESELSDRNTENLYIGGALRLNLNPRRWEY